MTTMSGGTPEGVERRVDLRSPAGRRDAVHDPAPAEGGQQLDGAGQRPPFGQDLAEDLTVPALQPGRLVVRQAPPDLAGDRAGEQPAAHADPAVDPPAVDRMARLEQCALPGEHVRVDGVHEGAVQVEDQRAHRVEVWSWIDGRGQLRVSCYLWIAS